MRRTPIDLFVMRQSNFKRVISGSSHPAHAIAVVAVAIVCSAVYGGTKACNIDPSSKPSSLVQVVYIVCTSLHAGAQFWMTFVSGLTLYFSLSRHAFGDVQRVLFPRYFTLNSILSGFSLIAFVKLHNHIDWTSKHYAQMGAIASCFLLETLARLYVAPRVLISMTEVRALELEVEGVGKEIGKHVAGSLTKCPAYVKAYSAFRRYHGTMAIANVLSMICTSIHLTYLAQFINFS